MNLEQKGSLRVIGQLTLPDWLWILARVMAPLAVGLFGTLLWSPSARPGNLVLVAVLLAACALLYVAVFAGDEARGRLHPWKWQVGSLLVAVVGVAVVYGAKGWAQPWLVTVGGILGSLGGIVTLMLMSVVDWRLQGPRNGRIALAALPWFVALELGPLLAWLLVYARRVDAVSSAHQSLLAAAMLVIMAEMLVFHRWTVQNDAAARAPRDTLQRIATVSNIRSWLGRIIPAALLALTMTNEGTAFAYLAWLLMFVAHGLRYLILSPLLLARESQET